MSVASEYHRGYKQADADLISGAGSLADFKGKASLDFIAGYKARLAQEEEP